MTRPFLFISARPEHDALLPEYRSMLAATGLDASALVHHRIDEEPLPALPLDGYAGVIVGGSPFNVTTAAAAKTAVQLRVERELAELGRWAVENDFPVLFTCYGIGVLTNEFGGTVDTEHGEDAGPVEISLSFEGLGDPLFGGLASRFTGLVGHKESTGSLPADAVLLASTESCPVQAFRLGRAVYATQFHPEVTPADFIARAHVYQHHGYFPAAELELVTARLAASVVTEPLLLLRRFVERFAA